MANTGKIALIRELSENLISYLRFIEKDTEKFVLLETELEHVRNYAKIQEMRFPGVFEYQEDVPIELYGLEIPPLILQTFMENSVEHGLDRDKKNWIRIHAAYQEKRRYAGDQISYPGQRNRIPEGRPGRIFERSIPVLT